MKLWHMVALCCVTVLAIIGLSPIANAASSYDNTVKPAPNFIMSCAGSSQTEDWSNSWYTKLKQAEVIRKISDPSFQTPATDYYESSDTNVMLEMWPNTSPYAGVSMFIANPEATISFGEYSYWSQGMVFHGLTDLRRVFLGTYSQSGNSSKHGCDQANLATAVGEDVLVEGGSVVGGGGSFMPLGNGDIFYPNNTFYQFINLPITYPENYEGSVIPTGTQPSATYVAMGDSFSSGEGNPLFEHGTDENDENECHRSPSAFPRLLQNDGSLNLGPATFVACSGATTNDILGVPEADNPVGTWGEDAQISAVSQTTEVVTITIGGNDVGFKQFATECLFPMDTYIGHEGSCDEFTSIYDETIDKINLELPDKLEQVYSALLTDAPNATIYVIGYPQLAPYKSISDPFDQDCGGLYDAWPNNWGDARAANEVVDLLNGKIEATVTAVNQANSSSRLVYVPVENGAFSGHDACSDVSYFHGIHWPNDIEYSVHPNTDGHIAYSQDVLNAMN